MSEWAALITVEEVLSMKASLRGQIRWVNQDLAQAAKDIKMLKRRKQQHQRELVQLETRRKVLANKEERA